MKQAVKDYDKMPRIDVWYGEGKMEYETDSVVEGKKRMKKLKSEGKEEIRMYADYPDGRRFYYAFDKSGNIIKENNDFDN